MVVTYVVDGGIASLETLVKETRNHNRQYSCGDIDRFRVGDKVVLRYFDREADVGDIVYIETSSVSGIAFRVLYCYVFEDAFSYMCEFTNLPPRKYAEKTEAKIHLNSVDGPECYIDSNTDNKVKLSVRYDGKILSKVSDYIVKSYGQNCVYGNSDEHLRTYICNFKFPCITFKCVTSFITAFDFSERMFDFVDNSDDLFEIFTLPEYTDLAHSIRSIRWMCNH